MFFECLIILYCVGEIVASSASSSYERYENIFSPLDFQIKPSPSGCFYGLLTSFNLRKKNINKKIK